MPSSLPPNTPTLQHHFPAHVITPYPEPSCECVLTPADSPSKKEVYAKISIDERDIEAFTSGVNSAGMVRKVRVFKLGICSGIVCIGLNCTS